MTHCMLLVKGGLKIKNLKKSKNIYKLKEDECKYTIYPEITEH